MYQLLLYACGFNPHQATYDLNQELMEHIYHLYVHSISSIHDVQVQLCYTTVLCLCSILQYNFSCKAVCKLG